MARNKYVSLIVAIVGICVVVFLWYFNRSADGYYKYIVGNLMALFWIPMLTILFLIREEPDKFGFKLCTSAKIWGISALLFIGLFVVMFLAAGRSDFQGYYPIFRNFSDFSNTFNAYPAVNPYTSYPITMMLAETSYGMYLFCWEFFFRGYMLMGLAKSIGWWSIIVQAAAFGLLHISKPFPEVAASFAAGIILGIIALRGKSFIPCFALHWAASITFNFLVVAAR